MIDTDIERTVSIEEIEVMMQEAVEREMKTPRLPEKVVKHIGRRSQRVVAGFDIDDAKRYRKLEDEARRELKDRWDGYGRTRRQMINRLAGKGITPRAVLPETT